MKFIPRVHMTMFPRVSTLVVEWIEIILIHAISVWAIASPPSWWSGLKSAGASPYRSAYTVSTLVVEWIEIVPIEWLGEMFVSPPSWWSGLKLTLGRDLSNLL